MSVSLCLYERCSRILLWLEGGCRDTSYRSSETPRQEVNWAEAELCRAQTTDDTDTDTDTDTDRGATPVTQHSMGKFNVTFLQEYPNCVLVFPILEKSCSVVRFVKADNNSDTHSSLQTCKSFRYSLSALCAVTIHILLLVLMDQSESITSQLT